MIEVIENVFRAGFRAGQEHGQPSLLERQGAAAGSQLGVEISKIRDRLNALESTAKVHTSCINGQCERIEKLEQQAKAMHTATSATFARNATRVDDLAKRIDVLETHKRADIEMVNERLVRIDKLEAWKIDRDEWELRQVQRIEKLENRPIPSEYRDGFKACYEALGAERIMGRIRDLEKMLERDLEKMFEGKTDVLKRIDAIEAKLRLQEPIG